MDWRSQGTTLFAGSFALRPAAHVDESFLGYRLRLADANGVPNPNWISCIDSSLPKSHGLARWCPHCLATVNGYWREEWHTGRAACFIHGCWLASVCGRCRRALRWKQVRFVLCTCGASLCDVKVDNFSPELLRLFGDQTDSNTELLSVKDRWSLARFIGALAQFGLQGKPLKKASRRTENIEQILLTTGASLIADQLAGFDLLDRLRTPQVGGNNVPLLSEVFPHLLTMLRKQLNEAERGWMLDLLNAYTTYSSLRGTAVIWERRGVGGPLNKGAYDSRKARNPAIASVLAQTGMVIPVRRTQSGRQKFVISRAELHDLRETQRRLVSVKTAARYAGLSTRRIQALAKAGLIASAGARIDMGSVDSLLGELATACVRDMSALVEPVSLVEALRLYVPVEGSAAFFDRLKNCSVRVTCESDNAPTLHHMFSERNEVISAVAVPVAESSQISIVEAARRISVKQEVMYHLINIGLLRTREGKLGRRAARVVDVNDLEKFTEQFLPLIAVARTIGVSVREAPDWARQHGIEVVSGPSVDGGRQYWIRRPVGAESA
ncbi:hypothetical protein PQR46_08155 [Paraburkholderia sediminicola]|uniref:hypothetical protein n=1 Tax=Paraburkholderia TaxID=1822464 RepID=UPI0038BBA56D